MALWGCRSSCPEVFRKEDVPRNFSKFTGKHLWQTLFFNKVAGLRPVTLLKKRLWHRRFPVDFAKFLRTPSLTKHFWWLLLGVFLWKLIHRQGHILAKWYNFFNVFISENKSFNSFGLTVYMSALFCKKQDMETMKYGKNVLIRTYKCPL